MKKNRYIRTKHRQKFSRLMVFIFGVSLFIFLLNNGLKASEDDPFANTPLRLNDDLLTFQGFHPTFNHEEDGKYITRFENGITVTYTLNLDIQNRIKAYLKRFKVPYSAFVAISPKTGKIIALVDYSSKEPDRSSLSYKSSYPAASIFKLITAAAAIEEKNIPPDLSISYRGKFNRLKPALWKNHPTKDQLKMTFSDAFAESNNVVFAKIAHRWLDLPTLIEYGERFYFNQIIPFERSIETSPMDIPPTEGGLERSAAGFGKVGLSPIHAALIGTSIANNGDMIQPCMIESVRDNDGRILYECTPRILTHSISENTAEVIRGMMLNTVENGTVKDIFQKRHLDKSIRNIKIGGKTGSLRGKNPPGRYTWFIGLAPLDDPEIVVAAMIVNDPVWHILAPQLAKEGFAAYFDTVQN